VPQEEREELIPTPPGAHSEISSQELMADIGTAKMPEPVRLRTRIDGDVRTAMRMNLNRGDEGRGGAGGCSPTASDGDALYGERGNP
jgi:hypothetical protein